MKHITIALLLLVGFASCNRIEKEERILTPGPDDAVLVINTPKARCHKCQNIVEGGLEEINGVNQSILNLNTKTVSIVYQPDETTAEVLKASVEKLTGQIPCK